MYRDFFSTEKIKKLHQKNFDTFDIVAQNIDCGYTLEPPKYPQSMFWSKNTCTRSNTPVNPIFT